MSNATRELVDLAIERFQEHDWGRSDVKVHWDDCDMDERRFWIYIWCGGINKLTARDADSTLVLDLSRHLVGVMRRFKKEIQTSDYEAEFYKETSPKRRYGHTGECRSWQRKFVGYDRNTWVYVMTLYGG